MKARKVIGVDIGGSHITAGMVDLSARQVIKESLLRVHVNSKGTADEIIGEWTASLKQIFSKYPECERRIGIAMPGPFNYEEGICLIKGVDKFESLYGLNIKKVLAAKLDISENDILFMNDASCFLKGEIFGGAAIGCNNVAGITLGTGLGSARFQDGKIHEGFLYCSPYKDGMAEDYLSTRWFLKAYKERTGKRVKNVKELCDSISEDETVAELFKTFGENLGFVLSEYVKTYSCDTIVIGGNIINSWEFFFAYTHIILNKLPRSLNVKKALLGEESALAGAASLCENI